MADWRTYLAMVRMGLDFCEDMDAFRRLMSDQAANAAACREEAPHIADEIRKLAIAARDRLSGASSIKS